ncbi:MAG: RNA polymerase sigma factor [Pirellulaceae bacterium]
MTHLPPNLTDEVVQRAKGDKAALGELFDHFYPMIFAFCMRRLVVRAFSEDVTSEIFLKMVSALPSFPGRRVEEFRRWIFRIATNEINAHLRQAIRRQELLQAAVQLGRVNVEQATEALGISTELDWEAVYKAIQSLTTVDQSIISLRFFSEASHDEIALTLDMKPGTVRARLRRALIKMREDLQAEGANGLERKSINQECSKDVSSPTVERDSQS